MRWGKGKEQKERVEERYRVNRGGRGACGRLKWERADSETLCMAAPVPKIATTQVGNAQLVPFFQDVIENGMGKSQRTSNSPKSNFLMRRGADFAQQNLSSRGFEVGSSSTVVQGADVMPLACLEDGRIFTRWVGEVS
ncbi:hypothetical protein K7X08_026444 [Anisodus acutangulus]|uniref:Uncharacterized protein n=1 Tax=Anisodus acutangulus TaxID=402998 RepID=A0A9Q1R613_9SOLA|nr:hypothetical protein K7X08_026444 [Anisodus acutangulus]